MRVTFKFSFVIWFYLVTVLTSQITTAVGSPVTLLNKQLA
jgi:hypothetical protein